MELIGCAEGSRASSSAPVCACVGLVLLKIDGSPVHRPDDVTKAMQGRTLIRLHFACEEAVTNQ